MEVFSFSLEVEGIDVERSDFADRLFEVGCDDALVTVIDGRLVLDFDRQANNLDEAICSATRSVERAGGRVVEPDTHASVTL